MAVNGFTEPRRTGLRPKNTDLNSLMTLPTFSPLSTCLEEVFFQDSEDSATSVSAGLEVSPTSECLPISTNDSKPRLRRQLEEKSREPSSFSPSIYSANPFLKNSPIKVLLVQCSPMISAKYVTLLLLLLLLQTGHSAVLKSNCKKVGYKSLIDETGCDLMAVFVNRCSGYCMSFSFANPLRRNEVSVYGKCCRMMEVEMIEVEVTCGVHKKKVQIPSARECGCFDCAK